MRSVERQQPELEEVAAEAPQQQAGDGGDDRELRERLERARRARAGSTMRPKPAIGIQALEVRRQRLDAERPAAERQRAEHRGADRGHGDRQQQHGCRRTGPRAARPAATPRRTALRAARRSRARRALRGLRRSSRCRRAARPPPAITTAVIASSRERGTSPRTRASSRRLALGCSVRSCCGVSFSAMVRLALGRERRGEHRQRRLEKLGEQRAQVADVEEQQQEADQEPRRQSRRRTDSASGAARLMTPNAMLATSSAVAAGSAIRSAPANIWLPQAATVQRAFGAERLPERQRREAVGEQPRPSRDARRARGRSGDPGSRRTG